MYFRGKKSLKIDFALRFCGFKKTKKSSSNLPKMRKGVSDREFRAKKSLILRQNLKKRGPL